MVILEITAIAIIVVTLAVYVGNKLTKKSGKKPDIKFQLKDFE